MNFYHLIINYFQIIHFPLVISSKYEFRNHITIVYNAMLF